MARTWWHTRRWLVFAIYVGLVFATVPIARDVVLTLRNNNLLDAAVTALYGAAVALVVYHVFFDLRYSDWLAFLVVAALISTIAALLIGVAIPEERVHFFQYGVMGLLARRSIGGPEARSSRAALAVVTAALLASALGLADECLQGLLPRRRFDWSDVALNAGAAVIALGLDELLHDRIGLRAARRARHRSGGSARAGEPS
jgi:VanZ family protein